MLKFRFRLGSFFKAGEAFEELAAKLDDWREFFQQIFLPKYLGDVQHNFDTEGALVGGWAPLSPRYQRWKENHFPGRRILERTLRLRRSLSPGADAQEFQVAYTPRTMTVSVNVPYAGWVNPRRRFLLGERDLGPDYQPLVERYLRMNFATSFVESFDLEGFQSTVATFAQRFKRPRR